MIASALTLALQLVLQTNVCPPRSSSSTNPLGNTGAIITFDKAPDPALAHNQNFFETHLTRLQQEIEMCKGRIREPEGNWTDEQNLIGLRLKKDEFNRLQELYNQYMKGELPTVRGQALNDLVMLKVLVGDPVIHMGNIPVGAVKGDGKDETKTKYLQGPQRNQAWNRVQYEAEAKHSISTAILTSIIPRGRMYGKASGYEQAEALRNVGIAVAENKDLLSILSEELTEKAPATDEDFNQWLRQQPRESRMQIDRGLRAITSSKQRREYQLYAWLAGTHPNLREAMAMNANNSSGLNLGRALITNLLSPADKRSRDEHILSTWEKSTAQQEPNTRSRRRVPSLSNDESTSDSPYYLTLKEYLAGNIDVIPELQGLSEETKLWLVLSGEGLSTEAHGAPKLHLLTAQSPIDLNVVTAALLRAHLSPAGTSARRVAAAILLLTARRSPMRATAQHMSEKIGDQDLQAKAPPVQFNLIDPAPKLSLPPQVVPGSADALAFSGFYDDNQVTQRLSSARPVDLDLGSFRRGLGLSEKKSADSIIPSEDARSARYPVPELQGSAASDPSYACQTYAVVSDLDQVLKNPDYRRVSAAYSYGLTVAQAELKGPPPDKFYAAMMEAARKKVGIVLPGQVEAVMDSGGSMSDALTALSRSYSLLNEDAPSNSKGEAFFPESISDFSVQRAKAAADRRPGVIGHDRVKVDAFQLLETSRMADEKTLGLISDMIQAGKPPIVEISTDARTVVENWFRPIPGQMGHYLNIVDIKRKTSAFDAKEKLAFLVRDSFVPEPIHYWVSAEELLPYITGIGKITKATSDVGFLSEEARTKFSEKAKVAETETN